MSNKSKQIPGNASASPAPGMPRTIYERMTNPTQEDMNVGARLTVLSRNEIDRIISHFGQALEHLASQRDDLIVKRAKDIKGWTIRVEMK